MIHVSSPSKKKIFILTIRKAFQIHMAINTVFKTSKKKIEDLVNRVEEKGY